MAFNGNFDPMQVSLGGNKPSGVWGGDPIQSPFGKGITGPYMQVGNQPTKQVGKQVMPGQQQQPSAPLGSGVRQAVMGPQSVRATGQGPYDPTFRQNLATYAGGQFARPGGNLSFNPTGTDTSQLGAQDSLLSQALGGQPFQFTPPTPQQPAKPKKVGRTVNPGDNARNFGIMR